MSLPDSLRQLCADDMHYKELTASLDGNWTMELPPLNPSTLFADPALKAQPNMVNPESITSVIRGSVEGGVDATRSSADAEDPTSTVVNTLNRLSLVHYDRYLGKSSQVVLVQMAIEAMNEYAGKGGKVGNSNPPMMKKRRPEFWGISEVSWSLAILLTYLIFF